MARVNDDGAELHPFKRLDLSEPFSSTDPAICVHVSRGKVMFIKIYYLQQEMVMVAILTMVRILEVLQLEMHGLVPLIFETLLLDIDFVVFFEYYNCLYCLPHCISALEIITHQSTHNLNKLQARICQKLSVHRALKLLTPLLSMVFTS